MEEDWRSRLDRLLGRYEGERAGKVEREEEVFRQKFHRLRGEVIRPVMEDLARHLQERSYEVRIPPEEKEPREARMEIYSSLPDGSKLPVVRIEFIARAYKRDVLMQAVSSVRGPLDLEVIDIEGMDRDVIRDHILKVFEKAFGP